MARGTMKLLDRETGLMACETCGYLHLASIRPSSGGKYYRGSWQCINGCGKNGADESSLRLPVFNRPSN
jgi:hypothetical protein